MIHRRYLPREPMGNFTNVVVTDAGLQLINEAIGGGQQVNIATAHVGEGYPAPATNPRDLTDLVAFVMDATTTSANYQVLYQTTVRISVSSGLAPRQFQLNEIGVFAQIGTGAPVLFAYASSPGQGDYITPDPSPTPIIYDYAILIQYEADSPVVATVTLQPALELHAATHRGNGIDPIGLADSTASGLLMSPPNNPNQVLLGTVPQSFGPIPKHAPTHLDNGVDPIPIATTARTGLMTKLSGKQSDGFCGDGSWQSRLIPAGVIWDYAGSNPPTGWLICDGTYLAVANFPDLFNAIGYTYGNPGPGVFAIPDFRGRSAIGAGQGAGLTNRTLGIAAGEEAHTLSASELSSHIHPISDPGHIHILEEGIGHIHQVNDPPHNHTHAENPHVHVTDDGAGHSHHVSIKAMYGPYVVGTGGATGVAQVNPGGAPPAGYVIQDDSTVAGWPADIAHASVNVHGAVTNIANQPAPTGITLQSHTTGATIDPHVTGITQTQPQASSGGSHNNMQPYIAVNKIIKF